LGTKTENTFGFFRKCIDKLKSHRQTADEGERKRSNQCHHKVGDTDNNLQCSEHNKHSLLTFKLALSIFRLIVVRFMGEAREKLSP
jgi:hypothetical protein